MEMEMATKPMFRRLQVETVPHVRRQDPAGRAGFTCRGRLPLLRGPLRHAWRVLLPGMNAGGSRRAGV